ncbi:hypothetical protein V8F20_005975 [Naviculisporaceae sp. PSN 640]
MKTSAVIYVFGLALPALAQELAPSPTQSIGCEPHGDHWHCEGPRPAPAPTSEPTTEIEPPSAVITTTATIPPGGDEHTESPGTGTGTGTSARDPGPSPTESIGCEPHGDHWHCEAPRPAETSRVHQTETSAPEPPVEYTLTTETTTAASGAASGTGAFTTATGSPSSIVTAGAAGGRGLNAGSLLGLAALAALV